MAKKDKKEEVPEKKEKVFSLERMVNTLKKDYGSLRVAGAEDDRTESISTGNKALDLALNGGIVWGYAAEWSGFSSTAKTTLLQYMLAYAQKHYNAIGIWIDRENSWFNERAKQIGIDVNNVIVLSPVDVPTVTDAAIAIKDILSKIPQERYRFLAIDSISAFRKAGKDEKADMGKRPQELHNMFRDALAYCDERMSMHFSNHRTYKIGVTYGNNTTTTGGEGPKYYTTYRIQLEELKNILDAKRGNEDIGNWLRATILKTRKGPGRIKVCFPHYFDTGIPYMGGYGRLLADRNYLKPKNKDKFNSFKQTTIKYGDNEYSEHNLDKLLEEHPELIFDKYPEYNINSGKEEEEATDE